MSAFTDKLSLIRGVLESWNGWNENQRKSACAALFWLCDQLLADLDQQPPGLEHLRYVRGNVLALKQRADKGAVSGELDIDLARDDYSGMMGGPEDDPLP